MVNSEDVDLTASFNNILETGLQYITSVAKQTEQYSQDQTSKFWRALLHKAYDILDKVIVMLLSMTPTVCHVLHFHCFSCIGEPQDPSAVVLLPAALS